jgi:hypothetical protein
MGSGLICVSFKKLSFRSAAVSREESALLLLGGWPALSWVLILLSQKGISGAPSLAFSRAGGDTANATSQELHDQDRAKEPAILAFQNFLKII